jgi:hypothetical protein
MRHAHVHFHDVPRHQCARSPETSAQTPLHRRGLGAQPLAATGHLTGRRVHPTGIVRGRRPGPELQPRQDHPRQTPPASPATLYSRSSRSRPGRCRVSSESAAQRLTFTGGCHQASWMTLPLKPGRPLLHCPSHLGSR